MKMAGRLQALESRSDGLATGEVHWAIRRAPQSQNEALDTYGRDKIGVDDEVMIFRIGFGPRARH